jgi:hypothetical protein
LIDALGGDLSNPVWNYRAQLCVFTPHRVIQPDMISAMSLARPIYPFRRIYAPPRFKARMTWGTICSWRV